MPAVAERAEREPTAPQQGVIEEARRRRRARARRSVLVFSLTALSAGIAIAVATSTSRSARAHPPSRSAAFASSRAASYDIRVWPTLTVGRTGWCMVVEEARRPRVSVCGGPASGPVVEAFGWGLPKRAPTEIAVTAPWVHTLRIGPGHAIATSLLPGLPYGLRAARFTGRPGLRFAPVGPTGRPIPVDYTRAPSQAPTRSWRYPSRPVHGDCEIRAAGVPAREIRGGTVARALPRYPGQLIGHGFLPCATTKYVDHGVPLSAFVLLDAEHPLSVAAALPDFHLLRGRSGVYAQGGLLARRSGTRWMLVKQGRSQSDRLALLDRLTAVVRAGR
jgi:hypothetical protein